MVYSVFDELNFLILFLRKGGERAILRSLAIFTLGIPRRSKASIDFCPVKETTGCIASYVEDLQALCGQKRCVKMAWLNLSVLPLFVPDDADARDAAVLRAEHDGNPVWIEVDKALVPALTP